MQEATLARGLGPVSEKLLEGLNRQIDTEFEAQFAYLAMAGWFDNQSLLGFSSFMEEQAAEERTHALKIYEYVLDRGGRVDIGPVSRVRNDFADSADAIAAALANEESVSESIKGLYDQAGSDGDHASHVFLEWFLNEQVEEEKLFDDILRRVQFAGDNAAAILTLDIELGSKEPG